MKIAQIKYYGGSREKVCRLGLSHLFLELQEILLGCEIRVFPEKQRNGAGVVRELIDSCFTKTGGWAQNKSGDIDWIKRMRYNESIVSRLGVEIQVSARSDLLARDIVHIRNRLQDSYIDVGVIVVPSDDFEYYLTDRVASFSYAIRCVEQELREAQSYPIIVLGIEHDGTADNPLKKKSTNRGKGQPDRAKALPTCGE